MNSFSIKVKLLLAFAVLLAIITLLNALQTAYVINRCGREEAFARLSHQLTLFKEELRDLRQTKIAVILDAARDEKNLSDVAVLYAQTLKFRQQPESALARTLSLNRITSINRLQLILDSARLSSAAVYLDGELSHYITRDEVGMVRRQAGRQTLIGRRRESGQGASLLNWRAWPQASLPVMVTPQVPMVDRVTVRFEFPTEGLMEMRVMVPVRGKLRLSFLEPIVEDATIPAADTSTLAQEGRKGASQVIGIFVFSQAFDTAFLRDIAHRTGMAPAILTPDGEHSLNIIALGSSPSVLLASSAPGAIQTRTINLEGASYYQAMTACQIEGETTLILAGALSRGATLATIRQTIVSITNTAALIFLIVGIFGYIVLTRMVAPITRLTKAVSGIGLNRAQASTPAERESKLRLALGRYLEGPIASRAKDEIGALTSAFNAMAVQLYKLIGNLETQVQGRTAELEEARNQARQYLEIAGVILVAIDRDHRVTLINQKGSQVLEAAASDIIGQAWFDTFVPQSRRRDLVQSFRELAAGQGQAALSTEYPVLTRRGRQRLIAWHHVLLRDGEGQLAGILSSGEDITEQRQAEEQILRLNQDLQQRAVALETANKELEAFTYSVSHDLRAPLRHIDGFIGLLKKSVVGALDEQGRHHMEAISEAAQKMGTLIDDLLTFSRMGRRSVSLSVVNLTALVNEVIRELAPDTDGRDILWRVDDLPEVKGDAAMLRPVLTNLIANAVKFTRTREKARIEIGSLPAQDTESVIFVRDNGVGFEMAYADKLFGVFQRLHRAEEFEGTGIGLATVHRIIARLGGRTWAEGEPDQGATFFFSLPQMR
jgi:PAS domain S-box-containing protein